MGAVMDGLGVRLATITGLRVYDYQADNVSPPAAVVALPQSLDYDHTMARGTDRATFPVHVLVGKVSDRASRDALAAYLAASGAKSIKAAIEADKTLAGAAATTRVMSAAVSVMTVAAVEHLAATFQIDVIA